MGNVMQHLPENLRAASNGECPAMSSSAPVKAARVCSASTNLTTATGDLTPLSDCLDSVLSTLTRAYGLDYYDTAGDPFQKVGLLIEMATDEGYGPKEFAARLRAMVKACPFPTWTPADFFKERAAVHPYGWYLKQLDETKANAALIDCYELADGSHGWGWKHEVRDMLPLYRPNEKPVAKELPDHAEPMPDDVAAQLKEFVKDVDVKEMERQDMADTITRLRADVGAARMERDEWKRAAADAEDAIAALHAVMVDVCEGRITVEQLKSRAKGDGEGAAVITVREVA
jgi:hypothetical protein